MPVLECPDCGAVVAWRGKALAAPCPGEEHPPGRRPTLDYDLTLFEGVTI